MKKKKAPETKNSEQDENTLRETSPITKTDTLSHEEIAEQRKRPKQNEEKE